MKSGPDKPTKMTTKPKGKPQPVEQVEETCPPELLARLLKSRLPEWAKKKPK